MILQPNSPLTETPSGVHRRQILFLDGIAVSIRVVDMTYGGLCQGLQKKETNNDEAVSYLVISAWSFIDAAHRLQALVRQMPGLKHSAPVKSFLKCFDPVTDLRNVYQHLSTEIGAIVDSGFPAWGALSWLEYVSPKKFNVRGQTLGRISTEVTLKAINPADIKTMMPPIDHVYLEASGLWVNLSDLYRGCEVFAGRLEKAVASSYRKLPTDAKEVELRIEPRMG